MLTQNDVDFYQLQPISDLRILTYFTYLRMKSTSLNLNTIDKIYIHYLINVVANMNIITSLNLFTIFFLSHNTS